MLRLPLPAPPPAPPRIATAEIRSLAVACVADLGQGESEAALDAAHRVRDAASDERIQEEPDLEQMRPLLGLLRVRLGLWDDVMDDPAPPSQARYATAMWHFVRASAFAAANRLVEAEAEYDVLRSMIRDPALATRHFTDGTAALDRVAVAERVLSSEIARMRGIEEDQLQFLGEASRVQDAAPKTALRPVYPWPRLQLAAALLRMGRAREAEFALRERLALDPDDGWALWGLGLSLRAQGKTKEAERTDAQFRAVWTLADITPDLLYAGADARSVIEPRLPAFEQPVFDDAD